MGLDDEGPYTCRAANEGGFKEEKAYVRVQGQYILVQGQYILVQAYVRVQGQYSKT